MDNLQLKHVPVAKTGMLIRKPIADVFEAFINPDITTKFWFTKSSGRLEAGTQVQWDWEMYGISIPVTVKAIEPNAGFTGDGDELMKQAADSTGGFSLVLAGLKALLEHNVRLNLVADRYPKGIEEH